MAGLNKIRKKWYSRVSLWDGYRQTHKQIPLYTESKTTAEIRRAIVNRHEKDIKAGIDVSFPWQNEERIVKYIHKTLFEVSNKFICSRKTVGLANSTIKRNNYSLNLFMKIVGKSIPIESINTKQIESFKEYCINKLNHSRVGVNINLKLIKTFLRWCVRNGYKKYLLDIQMIKIPQSLPSYISDLEWSLLIKSSVLGDIDKKTFQFALETGCRLSEPYHGKIDGHWLILPAEYTKSKIEREIFLTDELIAIWYEMQNNLQKWLDRGYKIENYISMISKTFLKACRSVNLKHRFHDLRHTFAVRRYLQTRDIYQVKKELGHSSVTTTEKYAKFSLRRLEQDFPSLVINGQNHTESNTMHTVSMYNNRQLSTD